MAAKGSTVASVNRTTAAIETQLKHWREKRKKVEDRAKEQLEDIDSVIDALKRTMDELGGAGSSEATVEAKK
jgi:L-lactate utilization protein LutB